jgi:hypothetical protein
MNRLWTERKALVAAIAGFIVVSTFVATAVTGRRGATERDTLVRARVWCQALEERDALRYQETFRRGYFRGRFDRFANLYREPTERSILARMPPTTSCGVDGRPRGRRGDVYVPVARRGPRGATHHEELRMRPEAGFWVVYQVLPRS